MDDVTKGRDTLLRPLSTWVSGNMPPSQLPVFFFISVVVVVVVFVSKHVK